MSNTDNEIDNSSNVTVDESQNDSDTENNESSAQESAQETPEEKIERLEKQNSKLFVRAKEAEGYKLVDGQWVKKSKPETKKPQTQSDAKSQSELSAKDIILLSNSGIKESEDLDEVLDFAKFKKLSISEALSNNTLKAILADKAETRRTAEITNTGGSRRVTTKITDETLLNNAKHKGILPESEDDMSRIVKARLGIK